MLILIPSKPLESLLQLRLRRWRYLPEHLLVWRRWPWSRPWPAEDHSPWRVRSLHPLASHCRHPRCSPRHDDQIQRPRWRHPLDPVLVGYYARSSVPHSRRSLPKPSFAGRAFGQHCHERGWRLGLWPSPWIAWKRSQLPEPDAGRGAGANVWRMCLGHHADCLVGWRWLISRFSSFSWRFPAMNGAVTLEVPHGEAPAASLHVVQPTGCVLDTLVLLR